MKDAPFSLPIFAMSKSLPSSSEIDNNLGELIARGREQGHLTLSAIHKHLADEHDEESISLMIESLSDMGIEILEQDIEGTHNLIGGDDGIAGKDPDTPEATVPVPDEAQTSDPHPHVHARDGRSQPVEPCRGN